MGALIAVVAWLVGSFAGCMPILGGWNAIAGSIFGAIDLMIGEAHNVLNAVC